MTVENISWSISTKECCRPQLGSNPRPPGWTCIQLSHRGRLTHIFRSSCTCGKCHPGLCYLFIHSVVSNDSVSGQWMPWSDCMDVQADLGLCCSHNYAWRYVFTWRSSSKLPDKTSTRNVIYNNLYTLWANSADNKLTIFFLVSENRLWHFLRQFAWNVKDYFLWKIRKNISKCLLPFNLPIITFVVCFVICLWF